MSKQAWGAYNSKGELVRVYLCEAEKDAWRLYSGVQPTDEDLEYLIADYKDIVGTTMRRVIVVPSPEITEDSCPQCGGLGWYFCTDCDGMGKYPPPNLS